MSSVERAQLADVDDFRLWAGAASTTVPDNLVQQCLDEAEAGLVSDVGVLTVEEIIAGSAAAVAIAKGDEQRRAANLLARRNSPEGFAGAGEDGYIPVPAGDPGSAQAVRRIRRLLGMQPVVVIA